MGYGQKTVIQLDPFNYNIGIIGEGGIGKTTIIFEMCEKYLPEGGYLFAECGKEDGGSAISRLNHINCFDWNSDYDSSTNSVGFKVLVEDILENKDTDPDYKKLRCLIVDTYDELRAICVPEIIRRHNKQYPDKKVSSIKAAFGGYMAGEDMVDDVILDLLWELKKVGVQFIIIGHTKFREITEATTGETYTQLTTDMSMRSFNKIKTKLHFLGVANIDREIVKAQKGKKTQGKIKSETRRITFRDDDYSIDSKSRFADIVDECPFTADAFYKAMQDAIQKEASKGNGGIEASEKATKLAEKTRIKKAKEYSESLKNNKVDEERNEELIDIIKASFPKADEEIKAKVKDVMAEYNIPNFKTTDVNTKGLEEIVQLLS